MWTWFFTIISRDFIKGRVCRILLKIKIKTSLSLVHTTRLSVVSGLCAVHTIQLFALWSGVSPACVADGSTWSPNNVLYRKLTWELNALADYFHNKHGLLCKVSWRYRKLLQMASEEFDFLLSMVSAHCDGPPTHRSIAAHPPRLLLQPWFVWHPLITHW